MWKIVFKIIYFIKLFVNGNYGEIVFNSVGGSIN